jgi:hypothetical protein
MKNLSNTALYIILLVNFNLLYGQVITNKQKVDDAFTEMDNQYALRFFDALNGKPIMNAKVVVGDYGEYYTDNEGRALFGTEDLQDGELQINFTHPKYIESNFKVEVMAGTIFFNRFSVSPILPIGALRIVLDWDKRPGDLDAHFVKTGDYHISYRNKTVSSDGVARLDRDDMNGYGPETITANNISTNSEYIYYVHDYTNQTASGSKSLSNSKACVKVFGNGQLLFVFNVPEESRGTKWEVFRISNGQIFSSNIIE